MPVSFCHSKIKPKCLLVTVRLTRVSAVLISSYHSFPVAHSFEPTCDFFFVCFFCPHLSLAALCLSTGCSFCLESSLPHILRKVWVPTFSGRSLNTCLHDLQLLPKTLFCFLHFLPSEVIYFACVFIFLLILTEIYKIH